MGRSRRRLKKSMPKVKVGLPKRKPRVFKASSALPDRLKNDASRAEWDDKGTVLKNYRAFGVVANPNVRGSRNRFDWAIQEPALQLPPSRPQHDPDVDPEFQVIDSGSDLEDDELKSALRKKRKDGKRAPLQRLTAMQNVYVGRLIMKYGDDYQAMFRDIKLNAMQHSVATLRSLCERYNAFEKLPEQEETY